MGCLYGLIAGDQARIWTRKPRGERRRAVLRVFNRCFGGPSMNPVDYLEYDWADQPYIRGGAAMSLGPGVLTEFPNVIRKPVQRIHWASTETATKSWGDMDGAIMSGERAANEILSG